MEFLTLPSNLIRNHSLLIMILIIPLFCGCAEVSQSLKNYEQNLAINKIKTGSVISSEYSNQYYKCSLVGPAQWSSRTGFPEFLVEYVSPDKITTVKLRVTEFQETKESNFEHYLSIFLKEKKTYKKLNQSDVEINAYPCKVMTFSNKMRDNPQAENMRTQITICLNGLYASVIEATTLDPLFEQNLIVFNQISNNFQWLDKAEKQDKNEDDERRHDAEQVDVFKEAIVHVIEKGNTLGSISKKYTGTFDKWEAIAKYNDIVDPGKLHTGEKILIPAFLMNELKEEQILTQSKEIKHQESEPGEEKRDVEPLDADRNTEPAEHYLKEIDIEKADTSQKADSAIEKEAGHKKYVVITLSPHDNDDLNAVQIMSGPGPLPLYEVVGYVPVGYKLPYDSIDGRYISLIYGEKKGFVFEKNIQFVE
ncbi:MAG: hypothetical protein VR65_09940 [Desulfobulbaceae bacterium BRH_c16a]|nr:MAG: hypothetical protein VR65_09940 [Desulfobulbaceae bacterium BRH_c16a]